MNPISERGASVPFDRLHIDRLLLFSLLALAGLSLAILYSASAKDASVTLSQAMRLMLGFGVMFAVAQTRPQNLERWSPYIFAVGLVLLLTVLAIGVIGKGAQRWLNLGLIRFQPSEFMKLGMPMMLAWFLSKASLPPNLPRIAGAFGLILVPTLLIARQPDLGTAILVLSSGLFVLFLSGMSWRVILLLLGLMGGSAPIFWGLLHDYQRNRILMLFNPETDPLGSGYHTIQSMIAIGSGGLYGKGWLNSSQAHLQYLPESSTDFIFSVLAEEFGLIGILLVVALYLFIVLRGMTIAFYAQDAFTRLLAGALSLTFFLHFFVNIGMVTGVLPVVGVPLPLLSYGGSSTVTLLAGFGVLMSIQAHRRILQH